MVASFALKLWTLQCGLMTVVITISYYTMLPQIPRPDSVNPYGVTHATIPIPSYSSVAEPSPFSPSTYGAWSVIRLSRLLFLAAAPISALLIGLSFRWRGDHPTQHDAWFHVTLCLYFVALVKLLYDVDFGLYIIEAWLIGFFLVTWHHLARSRVVAQTMRELRSTSLVPVS